MHGSVFISVHQWFDSSDSFSANAARTDSFGGGDGCENSTQEKGE
jgi:hypothetical protein